MSIARLAPVAWAAAALLAAGCSGVTSTLRYGQDGEPEYYIECTDQSMSRCYGRALKDCPQGYRLVKEERIPQGARSGSLFGRMTHVGAESSKMMTSFINTVVVRCKKE